MDKPKSVSTSPDVIQSAKRNSSASSTKGTNNGGEDVTSCLITPPAAPNISIGRLYVYNFSPTSEGTTSIEIPISAAKLGKYHSPATSSGPICRICHEGDGIEDLVSPCKCTGTVGLVHISCIERWLGLAGRDKCELCNHHFVTMRSPGTFFEWIRDRHMGSEHRRSLLSDLMCFCLLTPLAAASGFLCVDGAMKQVSEGNSLEAGCLMALATFLITIYFVWNSLTFRYHIKKFIKWSQSNQKVRVLRVTDLSCVEEIASPNITAQTTVRFSESGSPTYESINFPVNSPSDGQVIPQFL